MSASPVRILAGGFGAGRCSGAPGTAGTLVAVPFAWGFGHLPVGLQILVLAVSIPLGAFVCGRAAREDPSPDPDWIVFDEMVGYWFAVALLPPSFSVLVLGFLLFRAFDILKPPPIRWIDRKLHGGWGIVLDDVAAGLAARFVLGLILWTGGT